MGLIWTKYFKLLIRHSSNNEQRIFKNPEKFEILINIICLFDLVICISVK